MQTAEPRLTDQQKLMKEERPALTARYLIALRSHLGRKSRRSGGRAQSLGRAVLAGGMVQLDLAVMHEQAVIALASSHDFNNTRNGALKRAGGFFAEALIPLEAAQR